MIKLLKGLIIITFVVTIVGVIDVKYKNTNAKVKKDVNVEVKNDKVNVNKNFIYSNFTDNKIKDKSKTKQIVNIPKEKYQVYVNNKFEKNFANYESACKFAEGTSNAAIKNSVENKWIWDNYPMYYLYVDEDRYFKYNDINLAINAAKTQEKSYIYAKNSNKLLWVKNAYENQHIIKNVPKVLQLPELYRGCEIASLCMLLNYNGLNVSKMELAEKISKDNTKFENKNNVVKWGNPNKGFVGDIYSKNLIGYGVYHKPIYNLAKEYCGEEVLDLSKCNFEDLFYFIYNDMPVWVITNTTLNRYFLLI